MTAVPAPGIVAALGHVGLTVSDADRSRQFYMEAFGFEEYGDQVSNAPYLGVTGYPSPTMRIVFLKGPGQFLIELQEFHSPTSADRIPPGTLAVGATHLCLVTSDLDALLARAEAAGGTRVTDPVTVDRGVNLGARAVYLRDLDGFTVELLQPSAESETRDESTWKHQPHGG